MTTLFVVFAILTVTAYRTGWSDAKRRYRIPRRAWLCSRCNAWTEAEKS